MAEISREDCLRVGVFTSTHGIKGEVKVYPTTDDSRRFLDLKELYLDTGKELIRMEIEKVRFFKEMVILKWKGINNINEIEKYKGSDLLIRRDQAVPLEENEVFIYDIIGSRVVTDTGRELGRLEEVLATGANDVYVVKTPEGKEILLPSIRQCILDVNTEKKEILVHLMPGLAD